GGSTPAGSTGNNAPSRWRRPAPRHLRPHLPTAEERPHPLSTVGEPGGRALRKGHRGTRRHQEPEGRDSSRPSTSSSPSRERAPDEPATSSPEAPPPESFRNPQTRYVPQSNRNNPNM